MSSNLIKQSYRPHMLELNRVERLYTGGTLLNHWQGLGNVDDSTNSEEFIMSTIEYIGFGKDVIEKGISRTRLEDGSYINIKKLIDSNRDAFLGKNYSDNTDGHSGVLARVGDSAVRLVLQVHPSNKNAQKYLDFPNGKTEAWYILGTRKMNGQNPCVYAGFKNGVTKSSFRKLFDEQNISGMLECLHKIDVSKGDVILIDSGMPHAMGAGSLFLELHEACDYTFRFEKKYSVRELSDNEMHYGIGYEALFNMLDYTTYTDEEIRTKIILNKKIIEKSSNGILSQIISYEHTEKFSAQTLELSGEYRLPDFSDHFILITVKDETTLTFQDGSIIVPQGRAVFVPANTSELIAKGNGELLIAYPFKVKCEG